MFRVLASALRRKCARVAPKIDIRPKPDHLLFFFSSTGGAGIVSSNYSNIYADAAGIAIFFDVKTPTGL